MTEQGPAQRTGSPTAQRTGSPTDQLDRDPGRAVATAWSDRFGRFAIRALQVLIVAALGVACLYLVGVLRLVVVPVMLALLLSAAFAPLVSVFHRKLHFPQSLAAGASMLLALLALGGVVTLVVFQVQGQWSSLTKSASDGTEQVQEFVTGPPLNLDASAFTQLRQSLTKFVTSGSFGSGALAGVAGFVDFITALLVL